MGTFNRRIVVFQRIQNLIFLLGVLAFAPLAPALAQTVRQAMDMPVSLETQRIQDKAESLFVDGNYERAYFIYRNELAPRGDKYAQYMVGYMHLAGLGVEGDRITAAAWYRLAAERGTPEFVKVRDQLMEALHPELKPACDTLFVNLRKQYGDLALVMSALRADYESLRSRTGSRVGADVNPVTVVDMRTGRTSTATEYYREIEERIEARLGFLRKHAHIEIEDLDADSLDLAAIERQVNQNLESTD
jgi:hypothetical protein